MTLCQAEEMHIFKKINLHLCTQHVISARITNNIHTSCHVYKYLIVTDHQDDKNKLVFYTQKQLFYIHY